MSIVSKHNPTKQSIRQRMLSYAVDYMKVRSVDLLDPIVALFIESLSEEIYKLAEDVSNIEYRMLNSLLDVLVPDISLVAHPAHCIVHAIAREKECFINKETSFELHDQKNLSKDKANLTFYPVCNTKLINGSIKYSIYNGLLYKIDKDQTKTLIYRSRDNNFRKKHSYWLGLNLDEEINSLDNISFFFDFPGINNKEDSLQILSFFLWKVNSFTLENYSGLYELNDNKGLSSIIELFDQFEISENVDKTIFSKYNRHFRTISNIKNITSQKKIIPEELIDYFPENIINEVNIPLLWIEIEYPPNFPSELLEIMTISINAFPVANKNLRSIVTEVNKWLPIIPLETGQYESLLSVHSVTDSSNTNYYELPFDDSENQKFRTYTLRKGGYERYSKRDVKEYLGNFINSLENHSSIKTGHINDNKTNESLLFIYKLINHLKKTIKKTDENLEIKNYLLLDTQKDEDVLFVKYWTTDCELANNLKQQTLLDCTMSQVMINNIYMLTSTKGGQYSPKGAKQHNLRLRALTRSEVLVTNDDIIDFCKNNLGKIISNVIITKGIEETITLYEKGFTLTTDIRLVMAKSNRYFIDEKEMLSLKKLLQAKSPKTVNYRIFIEHEN